MRRSRFQAFYIGALAVAGIGLVGSSFVPRAKADAWNKVATATVSGPVIGGPELLNSSTYVWTPLEFSSERRTAQIFGEDQKSLEETTPAMPPELCDRGAAESDVPSSAVHPSR